MHGCSGWWAGLYHREDLSTCDTTDGLVLGLGAGMAMPHFPKARSLWGSFHLHANLIWNSKLPNGSEANLVKRRRAPQSYLLHRPHGPQVLWNPVWKFGSRTSNRTGVRGCPGTVRAQVGQGSAEAARAEERQLSINTPRSMFQCGPNDHMVR